MNINNFNTYQIDFEGYSHICNGAGEIIEYIIDLSEPEAVSTPEKTAVSPEASPEASFDISNSGLPKYTRNGDLYAFKQIKNDPKNGSILNQTNIFEESQAFGGIRLSRQELKMIQEDTKLALEQQRKNLKKVTNLKRKRQEIETVAKSVKRAKIDEAQPRKLNAKELKQTKRKKVKPPQSLPPEKRDVELNQIKDQVKLSLKRMRQEFETAPKSVKIAKIDAERTLTLNPPTDKKQDHSPQILPEIPESFNILVEAIASEMLEDLLR